ncbi:MAG: sulfatase [Acidobacteriota bacterium]
MRSVGKSSARSTLTLVLGLAVAVFGCAEPPAGEPRRLLDALPDEALVAGTLGEQTAVWSWRPEAGRLGWTWPPEAQVEATAEGLRARSSRDTIRLVRSFVDQPVSASLVRLRAEGELKRVYVRWSDRGVPFDAQRSAAVMAKARTADGWLEVSLPPGLRVERLALDLRASGPVLVREVELVRRAAEGDSVPTTPRWVTLNQDRRAALVTASGAALRLEPSSQAEKAVLEPIRGGMLRLGLGALAVSDVESLRFRVDGVTTDGETLPLLDESFAEAGGWWDRAVALPPHRALESVSVRLDAEPADAAFGLWAHPEVGIVAPPRAPNVVLVSIDTLRADRMSLYGHERATTQFLDAWAAAGGVVFEQAVATAPRTLPSHASMLSGLDAHRHGVNLHEPVSDSLDLLPEMLYRAGWSTHAVTGGGLLDPSFGFAQGFQSFAYWDRMGGGDELVHGVEQALAALDRLPDGRPFFFFFHTYEIHDPYRARPPLVDECLGAYDPRMVVVAPAAEREGEGLRRTYHLKKHRDDETLRQATAVTDDDLDWVGCLYDSGVARADREVGRLLAALDARGARDDTIVIITSDHGESLGEYGRAKHAYLDDANLLVPLIVRLPGARDADARRIADQVSLVDLVPTVLELVGVDPETRFDGVSLVPLLGREGDGERERPRREAWSYAALENRGLSLRVDGRLRYVFDDTAWVDPATRERVFDRRVDESVGDEATEVERAVDDPALAARLRGRVEQALSTADAAVRWTLENPGCVLRVDLSGRALGVESVKVAPGSSLRLQRPAPRRVAFELADDEHGVLRLLAPSGELEIDVRGTCDGRAVRWRIDQSLAVDGSRSRTHWIEPQGEGPSLRIVLRAGGGALPRVDEASEERLDSLRSLGYID